MSVIESMSPRAARSRAKILEAATELLVEHGARSVTVDAVEAASGVAKSTLYRHFSSRNELLVEVARGAMTEAPQPDMSAGFEAALRQMAHDAAASFGEPQWSRTFAAIIDLRTSMPELEEMLNADLESKHAILADVLALGVAEGRLAAPMAVEVAMPLLVGPLIVAAITGPSGESNVEALHSLAELVVDRFVASCG